jgi:hypothetical protein
LSRAPRTAASEMPQGGPPAGHGRRGCEHNSAGQHKDCGPRKPCRADTRCRTSAAMRIASGAAP